jgi:Gpi18-like mannosyltransferase
MRSMPSRSLPLAQVLWVLVGLALIVGSLALRLSWYPVVTSDYIYFTRVWFETLSTQPGLTAFSQPFSNYAPLYLYLLKLLTWIPSNSLALIKSLSVLGDVALGVVAVMIARATLPLSRAETLLLFALTFTIPTAAINSGLWGQSDVLYAVPVLLSLYGILTRRPLLAAIAFGIAVSIKVQAVFFAPILIGYLLQNRTTWKHIVLPPLTFLVSILPAALFGGSAWYWFTIYARQASEYPHLSLSAPSIYAFVMPLPLTAETTTALFWAGIIAALAIAFLLVWCVREAIYATASTILSLALLSVLALPYFLPRMHERYFFLADILSFLYAVYRPDRWYIPLLVITASFLSYLPYLSSQVPFLAGSSVDLRIPAVLLGSALVLLVRELPYALPPRVPNRAPT